MLEYHDEMHWSRFDKASTVDGPAFEVAQAAIDTFFGLAGATFCCMLCDRTQGDITKSAGGSWKAYEQLSCHALCAAIHGDELVSVLADHADTPPHIRFEDAVRRGVNEALGRLAISTVTRIHSHAADGLQLTDLLLGASMFDFRQGAERGAHDPDSQKGRLCRRLLDHCEVASFRPNGKEIEGKFRVEMRRRRRTRRGRRGGDPT